MKDSTTTTTREFTLELTDEEVRTIVNALDFAAQKKYADLGIHRGNNSFDKTMFIINDQIEQQ